METRRVERRPLLLWDGVPSDATKNSTSPATPISLLFHGWGRCDTFTMTGAHAVTPLSSAMVYVISKGFYQATEKSI